MNTQILLYILPYFVSLVITAGVGVYTWRHRHVSGALSFCLAIAGQALWIFGYILELLSPTLEGKIFWDDVQFIGSLIYPMALFSFGLRYTGHKLPRPWLTATLLSIPPAIFFLLLLTDRLHGLVRPSAWLVPDQPFSVLLYDYSPAIWGIFIYFVFVALAMYIILFSQFLNSTAIYRSQMLLILIGVSIPLIGVMLTIAGVNLVPQRDTTPFTFAIGNLFIAWGLFRYRLLDLAPVARQTVIENMRVGLVVLDKNLRVVDINPAAARFINQPGSQAVGKLFASLFDDQSQQVDRFAHARESQAGIRQMIGEEERVLELSISPLQDPLDRPVGRLVMIYDVTARVNAENSLERYRRSLEDSNRELEAFAYSVSHDLRAPLRAVDGYSQALLEDYASSLDEMGKAYLQYIRDSSKHMSQLIDDLLRLSRIMRSEIHVTEVDLSALARGIADVLKEADPGRQVEFVIQPDLMAFADLKLIHIAMQNLLDNAWKFTSKHSTACIEVGARLYTPAGDDGDASLNIPGIREGQMVYYVRDNGAGFNMDYKDKLFNPFQRLHGANEFMGSGIGLATVQRVIRRHKGLVWAEGAVEQGATVYFTLDISQ